MTNDENGITVRVVCAPHAEFPKNIMIQSVGEPYFCPYDGDQWTGDEHCKRKYVYVFVEEKCEVQLGGLRTTTRMKCAF